jgi:AcrR family transcriptional regulator
MHPVNQRLPAPATYVTDVTDMPFNPDDPRVRKTRKGLQQALVRLILKQGYDSISIQDIAAEAETARITFYRHYHDKEALLTDCLNALYEELAQKTEQVTAQALMSGYSPVSVLYEHIEEQETLYRVLFSSRGTQTVIERLRHHMAVKAMETMQNMGRTPKDSIPAEIVAYHAASAQLGLAMWWLDHGKPYPADYMARLSLWLTLNGLFTTFGITGIDLPIPTPD